MSVRLWPSSRIARGCIDMGCGDSVVDSVVESFVSRSKAGQAKYGTTMDRNDLTPIEWIQHLQEELMDAIIYLEKVKQTGGI